MDSPLDLTAPNHLLSNEEMMKQVREAIKKDKKKNRRGKVVHKSKFITPETFFKSKLFNR